MVRTLTMPSVLFLQTITGAHGQTPASLPRYVTISHPNPVPANSMINLGDVMIYGCNGQVIVPVGASMSSTHGSGCFPADRCIDFEATNTTNVTHCASAPLSMCHSNPGDPSPMLQIDLGSAVAVSRVFVLNRADCCASRIVGFQIGLYGGLNATQLVGSTQTFRGTSTSYSFTFDGECTNGVPTPTPTTVAPIPAVVAPPTMPPGALARYIYIYHPTPVPPRTIINLGEVTVYGCNGQFVVPIRATMSSNHGSGCFPANQCIDFGRTNSTNTSHCAHSPLSMCHSDPSDSSPTLQIDLGAPTAVSGVFVLNRGDCCQNRIMGFQIGLFVGPNGTQEVGQAQTFTSAASTFNFTFKSSCGTTKNSSSHFGSKRVSPGVLIIGVVVSVVVVCVLVATVRRRLGQRRTATYHVQVDHENAAFKDGADFDVESSTPQREAFKRDGSDGDDDDDLLGM
eukprot:m.173592 g.173592  ORF g.173592 m.173592 type:complete len:454 (+) comp14855_c0_seq1:81-1442(+)